MDMLNWDAIGQPENLQQLEHLEKVYEVLDTYLWLSLRFPDMLPDEVAVREACKELDKMLQISVENILELLDNSALGDARKGSLLKKMRERAQTQKEKEEFEEARRKELKLPEKRKGVRKSVLQSVLSRTDLSPEELEQLKQELNEQKVPYSSCQMDVDPEGNDTVSLSNEFEQLVEEVRAAVAPMEAILQDSKTSPERLREAVQEMEIKKEMLLRLADLAAAFGTRGVVDGIDTVSSLSVQFESVLQAAKDRFEGIYSTDIPFDGFDKLAEEIRSAITSADAALSGESSDSGPLLKAKELLQSQEATLQRLGDMASEKAREGDADGIDVLCSVREQYDSVLQALNDRIDELTATVSLFSRGSFECVYIFLHAHGRAIDPCRTNQSLHPSGVGYSLKNSCPGNRKH
ncbi:unnamed protein product [Nippostrongylus brasiliensis]|uniref:ATP-dependent RNA helicase SUPV3L1, mitochondrial (inferred by orthology to a human protein) n=1 Tax=Nippostrongylus brasiliensis TaxID=27835 RepID=A0A0N4YFU4_NIPBR|nr:unnamed protein product [Nippostrongylus brasiliensis]